MARYVSGGGVINPRSRRVFRDTSLASLAIPWWAQGRLCWVTGIGGGGSSTNAVYFGGSGAFAIRHPILLPSGATTLSLQVGAGGLSSAGGDTILMSGSTILLCLGGGLLGAGGETGGLVSAPYAAVAAGMRFHGRHRGYTAASSGEQAGSSVEALASMGSTLFNGSSGMNATVRAQTQSGWSPAGVQRGGSSPFGSGASDVIAATGYGSGAGNAAQACPGFIEIEFVEAV